MTVSKDLMFQEEIRDAVREAYGAISSGAGEAVARRLYSDEELAELPGGALDWALGVGNPVRYAFLQPGEVVLDIGSGAGIDTILAARRVGHEGRAIGLDILEEMCERARAHSRDAGVGGWTEFRQGDMQRIPLPDASVDVVISNGVLNLFPDKMAGLAEMARVLKPGGRLQIGDILVGKPVGEKAKRNIDLWKG